MRIPFRWSPPPTDFKILNAIYARHLDDYMAGDKAVASTNKAFLQIDIPGRSLIRVYERAVLACANPAWVGC